jgi:hypothetical protein
MSASRIISYFYPCVQLRDIHIDLRAHTGLVRALKSTMRGQCV